MSTPLERLDYDDLQAIIAKARIQRSAAVGDAIAGLMTVFVSGLTRALNALKSGTLGSGSHRAGNDSPVLDASGHR